MLVIVFCCTVSRISTAEESDVREAKKHFQIATDLYEEENYEGAAAELEISVKLYPTKNGYFNLANCYKALHKYQEALSAIEQLNSRFEDKMDKTMKKKMEALQSSIQSWVGELTLFVSPAEAMIRLDGKILSSELNGSPILLSPGGYTIEATLDGFEPSIKRISINSQQQQSVEISLSPLKGTLSVRANVDGAAVIVDGRNMGLTPIAPFSLRAGKHRLEIVRNGYDRQIRSVDIASNAATTLDVQLTSVVDSEKAVAPSDRHRDPWPALQIVGVTGTATTAVLAGVFYGLAAKQASDYNRYNDDYVSAPTDEAAREAKAERSDAKEKTLQFSTMGLAFGVTAGVLGVTTIVLFVVAKKRSPKSVSTETVSLRNGSLIVRF
jgi:hypothetical protein